MEKILNLGKTLTWFFACCTLISLVGCSKTKNADFIIDAAVQIQSFKIGSTEGIINQNTGEIEVTVPFGTDITSQQPVIALPQNAVSSPAASQKINFTGLVTYKVTNGNTYKDYTVTVKIVPPLKSFKINNVNGAIDHANKSVSVVLTDVNNLSALVPTIETESGVTVSPASGVAQNFSNTVAYTFTTGSISVVYNVNVVSNSTKEYAFVGTAATLQTLTNDDEKAAATWFFANYPESDYVSFSSIEGGRNLSNYKLMWWHFDAAQDLPAAALISNIINALKVYRASGGNLLLTSFATKYVEPLGVVPAGRGPNNAFGDFLPNGFVAGDDWGISFKGKENHPIFQNLQTYETGKAYLLEKGTFRLNHTAWWFLPDWGGYGNGANWRTITGGVNLASEGWDDNLNGRVGIAEWPSTTGAGNVVIIAFGAYDWYSEPVGTASTVNAYLPNIKTLTKNTIDYLKP